MCLDNKGEASTSYASPDDTIQTPFSYECLNNATKALISKEEFQRMTSVRVVIEKLIIPHDNASETTELSVHKNKN